MTRNAIDLNGQFSVPVSGASKKPGETIPMRHPLLEGRPFPNGYNTSSTTFYELVLEAFQKFSTCNFLGHRSIISGESSNDVKYGPYVWETYEDVHMRMKHFAAGLAHLGLKDKCNVGLYFINRPEWVIADLSCQRMGYVSVPLYDTLGEESIAYIIKQTESNIIITTNNNVNKLLKICNDHDISCVKQIITVEDGTSSDKIISWKDVEALGKEHLSEHQPSSRKASDLMTICYTSGTTGDPKGVMLTQGNILAAVSCYQKCIELEQVPRLDQNDIHFSYLPLAHIFERALILSLMTSGLSIGFYHGDMIAVVDDLAELKPTLFAGVPRVFNRLYDKVMGALSEKGFITRCLFSLAYNSKANTLKHTKSIHHWLWDRLVFSAIRNRLGGRVRFILSAGAPIDPKVKEFLLVAIQSDFIEAYGQTETAALGSVTFIGDYGGSKNVGAPSFGTELKLVDVPELDYFSDHNPPQGEICIKGPSVFTGYYKNPEKTSEVLDNDGWAHTGDIGELDPQGRLRIIDRKKSIFKLSQGEYVAPERIEAVITRHELVEQAFVYGNSLRSFPIAVIVPDKEQLMRRINNSRRESKRLSMGLGSETPTEELIFGQACKDNIIHQQLLEEMQQHCRKEGLKGFEIPKMLYLEKELFSVENELLTVTFKIRRPNVTKKYRDVLNKMYESEE